MMNWLWLLSPQHHLNLGQISQMVALRPSQPRSTSPRSLASPRRQVISLNPLLLPQVPALVVDRRISVETQQEQFH